MRCAAGEVKFAGLVVLAQSADELSAKDLGKGFDWEQEDLLGVGVLLAGDPVIAIGR